MEPLFELIGYEPPSVLLEDGEDDYEPDDPAYITPPLKGRTEIAPNQSEPSTNCPVVDKSAENFPTAAIAPNPEPKPVNINHDFSDLEQSSRVAAILLGRLRNAYCFDMGSEELLERLLPAVNACEEFLNATKAIAPDIPPPKPKTQPKPQPPDILHGGYIEEKQIKKNGKLVGIYLYERYREGGKLKSKYIGRKKGT